MANIIGKAATLASVGFQCLSDAIAKRSPGKEMTVVDGAFGIMILNDANPTDLSYPTVLEAKDHNAARKVFKALGMFTARKCPEMFIHFVSGFMAAAAERSPEFRDALRKAVELPALTKEDGVLYAEYCVGRERGATHEDMAYLNSEFDKFRERYTIEHP